MTTTTTTSLSTTASSSGEDDEDEDVASFFCDPRGEDEESDDSLAARAPTSVTSRAAQAARHLYWSGPQGSRSARNKTTRARRAPFARRMRGEHLAASMTLASCSSLSEGAVSRARAALREGATRLAANELRVAARLCEGGDEMAWLYAALAACACRLGEPHRAIAACEEGRRCCCCEGDDDDNSRRFMSLRAAAVARLGRFDESAALCRRVLSDDSPTDARVHAHHTLAICLLESDDHAAAYREFARGALVVGGGGAEEPDSPLLAVEDLRAKLRLQVAKRAAYYPRVANDVDAAIRSLGSSPSSRRRVAAAPRSVVRARAAIDRAECAKLVALARAADRWQSDRHGAHPTRDVAVADVSDEALALVNGWLRDVLLPLAATHFYSGHERLLVHDAFVVYYCADSGHASLPTHRDQAHVSMTLGLNSLDEYRDGGLWFEETDQVVPCDVGDVVVFSSSLAHAARPLAAGQRFVLALFLYADDDDDDHNDVVHSGGQGGFEPTLLGTPAGAGDGGGSCLDGRVDWIVS